MKLWEAILVGCDKRAQGFGYFFKFSDDGEQCVSCAFGAAMEASGVVPTEQMGNFSVIQHQFPFISAAAPNCPVCSARALSIAHAIVHLNDDHLWPREKIAIEFVKPIEETMTTPHRGLV